MESENPYRAAKEGTAPFEEPLWRTGDDCSAIAEDRYREQEKEHGSTG